MLSRNYTLVVYGIIYVCNRVYMRKCYAMQLQIYSSTKRTRVNKNKNKLTLQHQESCQMLEQVLG
jgi:hypothetical protein